MAEQSRRGVRFWIITLGVLLGIALTSSLGLWQLSRADQKLAVQAAQEERARLPALDNAALGDIGTPDAQLHRPVRVRGRWLGAHTVFLDNRQMHGTPGFYVLTPLQLEGSPRAVVVQRGWVQRNFLERDRLPPVQTPTGVVELQGRLAGPPSRLFEFAAAGPGKGSSAIRQNLDLAAFSGEAGLPLAAFTVVQTDPPSEGLLRDWPQVASGVGKHYGYAFQWFGLSSLMAVLYVWFQFIAPRRKSRSA